MVTRSKRAREMFEIGASMELEDFVDWRLYEREIVAGFFGVPLSRVFHLEANGQIRRAPGMGRAVRYAGAEVKRFAKAAMAPAQNT